MNLKLIKTILVLYLLLCGSLFAHRSGGGQQGGNQPCFNVGDVVSTGSWYGEGFYNVLTEIYIGNCEVRATLTRNGQWYSQCIWKGGCYCGRIQPNYNRIEYPLAFFNFQSNTARKLVNLITPIPVNRIEIWSLNEQGKILFSAGNLLKGKNNVEVPENIFTNGKNYLIVGFNKENDAEVYLTLQNNGKEIVELPRFCSWGGLDTLKIQKQCVTYTGKDSVMIMFQMEDKSIKIIKGTWGKAKPKNQVINNNQSSDSSKVAIIIIIAVLLVLVVIILSVYRLRKKPNTM